MAEPTSTDPSDIANLESIVEAALVHGEMDGLAGLLDEHVVWGDCRSRADVLATVAMHRSAGLQAMSASFESLSDRLVVSLDGEANGQPFRSHQTLFMEDGVIVEIVDSGNGSSARGVQRAGPFVAPSTPTRIQRVAPVLPVRNVDTAIAHYEMLGFSCTSYGGDAAYGYAQRGDIEFHLAQVGGLDPAMNSSAVYLYVDDATALYAEWRAAGVAGRLIVPEDTDYGLSEGAHVDPDGNLLRFGSPLT